MSFSDWPAARSSRMNSTARRVPRITGLDPRGDDDAPRQPHTPGLPVSLAGSIAAVSQGAPGCSWSFGGRFLTRSTSHVHSCEAGLQQRTIPVEFDSYEIARPAHESAADQEALQALASGAGSRLPHRRRRVRSHVWAIRTRTLEGKRACGPQRIWSAMEISRSFEIAKPGARPAGRRRVK